MSVLRRWDDLDSSNEEEVTIDETSYIEIWQKISFCVTNKVEINALQGYSTFVTDEMSQNTLYLLCVLRCGFQLSFYIYINDEVTTNLVDGHVWDQLYHYPASLANQDMLISTISYFRSNKQ